MRNYLSKTATVCATLITFVVPAFNQISQDAAWTGQVQCQLAVQTNDYVHQEVQTWTITGPSTLSGSLPIYPATWSVSGQGRMQRAQGAQVLTGRWNSSVVGMNAP